MLHKRKKVQQTTLREWHRMMCTSCPQRFCSFNYFYQSSSPHHTTPFSNFCSAERERECQVKLVAVVLLSGKEMRCQSAYSMFCKDTDPFLSFGDPLLDEGETFPAHVSETAFFTSSSSLPLSLVHWTATGGGVLRSGITEISGEAGSGNVLFHILALLFPGIISVFSILPGKTQICLSLSLLVILKSSYHFHFPFHWITLNMLFLQWSCLKNQLRKTTPTTLSSEGSQKPFKSAYLSCGEGEFPIQRWSGLSVVIDCYWELLRVIDWLNDCLSSLCGCIVLVVDEILW